MADSNSVDDILTVDKVDEAEEQDKQITQMYRRVFSSEEGRIVFQQILIDCFYFQECVTDTQVALNNFAKFMINNRLKINNVKQKTDAIIDAGLFKSNL